MKKDIFIYEKDEEALGFLREFFKRYPLYSATFISDLKDLRTRLKTKTPHALIADSSSLGKIRPSEAGCPVIATVPGVPGGMRSVAKHGIDYYLIHPYHKDDLKYKLEVVTKKENYLEALSQQKKHLNVILELTQLVSSTLDPEKVLYFVVKKLSEIMDVTRCSMLSMGYGETRFVKVVSTFEDPDIKHLKLDLRKYPEIKQALKTKKPVVIKDAMRDPLMKAVKPLIAPLGIKSIVVLPVVFRNEVIGTLFLRTSRKGHVFTEKELKLCQSIANASGHALNNAFLFEKLRLERERLEKLSITDFLTGIYNIRYFYHRLESEFSRAQRYNAPLSCLMLDIDHFKKINDTYGHRTGDMVLREFACLVRKHIRKSDVFARYGGEEFILLLPHTHPNGAMAEGKRLGNVVKTHHFKGMKEKQRITISTGIVSMPHKKIKTYDDLINLADNALLKAKESGRNRIVVQK